MKYQGTINFGNVFLNEGNGNHAAGADIRLAGDGLITSDGTLYLTFDNNNDGVGTFVISKGSTKIDGTESKILRINNDKTMDLFGSLTINQSGGALLQTNALVINTAGHYSDGGGDSGLTINSFEPNVTMFDRTVNATNYQILVNGNKFQLKQDIDNDGIFENVLFEIDVANNLLRQLTGTATDYANAVINDNGRALVNKQYVEAVINTVPTKINLTLQNGWTNVAGEVPIGVRKTRDGMILLDGYISGGTTTGGTIITNLPSEYHPPERFHFIVNGTSGLSQATIETNGDLKIRLTTDWGSIGNVAIRTSFFV